MKVGLLLSAILISFISISQNIPSTYNALDTTKKDTALVHALIKLSKKNQWINSYSALNYADQAGRVE